MVPGFAWDPALEPIHRMITSIPKLLDALQDLLGHYRVLSRDELYIDRSGTDHTDMLADQNAIVNAYNQHLGLTSRGQMYSQLPNNESHRIATVAVYLQDHMANNQSLRVKPRSHLAHLPVSKVRTPAHTLHPRIGDMIVFDSRLVHSAQPRVFGNFKHDVRGPHRTSVSITFGRNNAFSDACERGFAMRSMLFTNLTSEGCGNLIFPTGDCANRAVVKDIKAWDPPSLRKDGIVEPQAPRPGFLAARPGFSARLFGVR